MYSYILAANTLHHFRTDFSRFAGQSGRAVRASVFDTFSTLRSLGAPSRSAREKGRRKEPWLRRWEGFALDEEEPGRAGGVAERVGGAGRMTEAPLLRVPWRCDASNARPTFRSHGRYAHGT